MEVGGSQLNLLELIIINRNGFMIFDWYQKSTFSGLFLIITLSILSRKKEVL